MATPEALIKYYDCLKESFNKIQLKDNKTALVNAALRPKIREEFAKSKDVLKSYLNYIQVFTLIYSENFSKICLNIFCPIFKEFKPRRSLIKSETEPIDDTADLIHETFKDILKSKPEVAEDLVTSVIKFSPAVSTEDKESLITYLSNCLTICTYINHEPLASLISQVMDRLSPPNATNIGSYELLYRFLDDLNKNQLDDVVDAILNCFASEYLGSDCDEQLLYLLLYICSLDISYPRKLIDLMWSVFLKPSGSYREKSFAVCFASSFMSRAKYIELHQVFEYMETSTDWCNEIIPHVIFNDNSDSMVQTTELVYDVVQSILYLITQRYRDMYEEDSIDRLNKLNLDKIINCKLEPLRACHPVIDQRFREVARLYKLTNLDSIPRSTINHMRRRWEPPFNEILTHYPDRLKPLFNNYYNHKNFTLYRE